MDQVHEESIRWPHGSQHLTHHPSTLQRNGSKQRMAPSPQVRTNRRNHLTQVEVCCQTVLSGKETSVPGNILRPVELRIPILGQTGRKEILPASGDTFSNFIIPIPTGWLAIIGVPD